MDVNSICLYNKFGHCRYKDTCRHRHVSIICDTVNCNIALCDKRHPKICRYFLNYGRCKFNPCSYSHILNDMENEKVAKIQDCIADLKSEIYELKCMITSNSEKLNQMVVQFEKTSMDMTKEIDYLKEKSDLHQLKLDVSQEEFHTYSQVVDTIEKKICQFFSLPYPLVPFPPNSILEQSKASSWTPTPPTPPCSTKKKVIH